MRSRKARAVLNSHTRARCVRSPVTATRCGRARSSALSRPSDTDGSCRPKCRSEMCAMRRTDHPVAGGTSTRSARGRIR